MRVIYEVELYGNGPDSPTYLYIEADEDMEIDSKLGKVTHITTIDTDMGLEPDLVISRREQC